MNMFNDLHQDAGNAAVPNELGLADDALKTNGTIRTVPPGEETSRPFTEVPPPADVNHPQTFSSLITEFSKQKEDNNAAKQDEVCCSTRILNLITDGGSSAPLTAVTEEDQQCCDKRIVDLAGKVSYDDTFIIIN